MRADNKDDDEDDENDDNEHDGEYKSAKTYNDTLWARSALPFDPRKRTFRAAVEPRGKGDKHGDRI